MGPTRERPKACGIWESEALKQAAKDFRYLLNRGYPRKASLELVGNRYQLVYDQRHLLHRGVFSATDSKRRLKKRIPLKEIRHQELAVDGYNVIITIEAGLAGHPLVSGDDGFIRDISGLSGNFRRTERTDQAIELILRVVRRTKPLQTLFLFDAPIGLSGELAEKVRDLMKKEGLSGDAKAVPVPEKVLIGFPGVVATSDTAIIDQSSKVVDLGGHIVKNLLSCRLKPRVTSGCGFSKPPPHPHQKNP